MNKHSSHNPIRWLITGGAGFIGTNLIAYLLEENPDTSIRVLDNLYVGTLEDLADVCTFTQLSPQSSFHNPRSPIVEFIIGDIRNYETCLKCCKDIDIVIHLAASTGVPISVKNPKDDMEANVIGTFNMLEASRYCGATKFIYASSGAPIGEAEPPIHEKLAPHPVSPYGASKLSGEAYCSAYYRTFGLETISLRFGNVYGPRSKHKSSVVAKFIRQAMNEETLTIYGDGKQTRDFIYINDLIRAIHIASSAKGIGGETFQIATNKETTVAELVDKMLPILAENDLKDVKPENAPYRLGDIRRNFSDTSKAKKMLGWQAEVELADGLRKTVSWFMRKNS
jgi:UDP-glucose 4-epimerase